MTDDGFREFVELRYGDLLRTTYLLTGSRHAGGRPGELLLARRGCAALLATDASPDPPRQTVPGHRSTTRPPSGRPHLVAVSVPGETRGVLVLGPESAARAELLDGKGRAIASGSLEAGVSGVRVDPRQVTKLNVLDRDGRILRTEATPSLGPTLGQLGRARAR
ncbi:hypothetical protein [Micromonospora olivasterospora]|uniref:Uncharacterized protein n=1 Tax=Micromonospora olivasterospora TaxID=1880 RepID=A0A562IG23_MICOL|nr:hypothetical protein [Micromonospora olivasterospora]TWH69554.1 hypothetical protein JD77_04564 [Micromonospora olivasterospora]